MDARQHPDNSQDKQLNDSRQPEKANQTTPKRPRWVFLGGIPRQVTKTDVLSYVKSFGQIKYFALPYSTDDKYNHLGFAKVLFETQKDTTKFVKCKYHQICGVQIGVSEWVSRNQHISKKEVPAENKIFFKFKRVPNEKGIRDYFSQFGKVQSVELKFNYKTNQMRDFGFIIFESVDSTIKVLENGPLHYIEGNKILVFSSKSQQDLDKEKTETNVLTQTSPKYSGVKNATSIRKLESKLYGEGSGNSNNDSSKSSGYKLIQHFTSTGPDRQPPQKSSRHQLIGFSFIKPTSKRWNHSEINSRHQMQANLCFRQLVVRFNRAQN